MASSLSSSSSSTTTTTTTATPAPLTVGDGSLVQGEEQAVQAWLANQGFDPGDLRSEKKLGSHRMMTPMEWAIKKSELKVYNWLCDNGGLVPYQEQAVRTWLVEQGFEPWDLRNEKVVDDGMIFPMIHACYKGELNVCRWLYNHGAAEDATKANSWAETPIMLACESGHLSVCEWLFEVGVDKDVSHVDDDGETSMSRACRRGHLSVCKWLFKMGADKDIHRADYYGRTPMLFACMGGNLLICEWLFKIGAQKDISRADYYSRTPMYWACMNGHLLTCEWLILNGAMNKTTSTADDEYDDEDDTEEGHVSQAIVRHETYHSSRRRPAFLEWAKRILATHHIFLHVVLRASVILPDTHHQASQGKRCHLPRLPRDELERVGSFLGVEKGRRLRNAREFAEALEAISPESDEDEEGDEEEENEEEEDEEDDYY